MAALLKLLGRELSDETAAADEKDFHVCFSELLSRISQAFTLPGSHLLACYVCYTFNRALGQPIKG